MENISAGDTVTHNGQELLVQFATSTVDGLKVEGRYIADDGTVEALASITATHYCSYCAYYGDTTIGTLAEMARHILTHPVTGDALPLVERLEGAPTD